MSFNISSQAAQAITGLSGIVTGIGQLFSAKDATDTGDFNAKIFEQKAKAERESQKLLETQKRKIIKSQIGKQIATTGASGFKFTGDPITILTESLANAEMDIAIDKFNSEVKARGFLNEANLEKFNARRKASERTLKASGSFLETAASGFIANQTLGGKGQKLGGGITSHGIKVPSRFIPAR